MKLQFNWFNWLIISCLTHLCLSDNLTSTTNIDDYEDSESVDDLTTIASITSSLAPPVNVTDLTTVNQVSPATISVRASVDDDDEEREENSLSVGVETNEDEEENFKIPQDAGEFMDYFDDLVRRVKSTLEGVFNQYWPQLFEMSSSVVLSPQCTYDVVRVLIALREMKPWAIKRE